MGDELLKSEGFLGFVPVDETRIIGGDLLCLELMLIFLVFALFKMTPTRSVILVASEIHCEFILWFVVVKLSCPSDSDSSFFAWFATALSSSIRILFTCLSKEFRFLMLDWANYCEAT